MSKVWHDIFSLKTLELTCGKIAVFFHRRILLVVDRDVKRNRVPGERREARKAKRRRHVNNTVKRSVEKIREPIGDAESRTKGAVFNCKASS